MFKPSRAVKIAALVVGGGGGGVGGVTRVSLKRGSLGVWGHVPPDKLHSTVRC